MNEFSFLEKLTSNLKLSKAGQVGMTLSYFDVIELLGELDALKAYIAELVVENDRLQDGWFDYETICPDGSLRPKVSDLLEDLDMKKTMISERDKALSGMVNELSRMEIAKDVFMIELDKLIEKKNGEIANLKLRIALQNESLKSRIVELEATVEELIRAGRALTSVAEWRYTILPELLAWDTLVDNIYKEREK